jgi:phosphoribosylanthranilate isomerase
LTEGVGTPLVMVIADQALEACVEAGRLSGAGVIQLHGRESPELVGCLAEEGPWRVWKAIRMREPDDLKRGLDRYGARVSGLLLDGWHPHRKGGTGVRFAWDEVAALRDSVPPKTLLGIAGGLSPENVLEAVGALRPDLVDVSSGVEVDPGRKSHARIREFVQQVRDAGGGVIQ